MAAPSKSLSTLDVIAMIVGIVIGAGIFRLPPLVAGNVNNAAQFIGVWVVGGLISLIGALCYAELATTYPNTGGDYYFLRRAFGTGPAFLYAWARLTVIQAGSIALICFVMGDYVAAALSDSGTTDSTKQLISAIAAAIAVVALTSLNMAGVRQGKWLQNALTTLVMLSLLLIVIAGLLGGIERPEVSGTAQTGTSSSGSLGLAMVFVLLTYGGWNEAAYLSAEIKSGQRSMLMALVIGLSTVMLCYVSVSLAYLAALGFDGVRASSAIAADTLFAAWGQIAALLITGIVIVAALSTANGCIFTGARTNYAFGRDFPAFSFLAQWNERSNAPGNALLVQGVIALVLVALAGQSGVDKMIAFTSWVFWTFFLLVGVSLIVLRIKEPDVPRPFRVPLYPILPLVFCATCGFMLYASLDYAKRDALWGVAMLVVGLPFMVVALRNSRPVGGAEVAPLAGPADTEHD